MEIKKKIKKVAYDVLLIILGLILPALGVFLLGAWDFVKSLMLKNIPFWVLFLVLIIFGIVIVRLFLRLKNIKQSQEMKTCLHNNLVYLTSDKKFDVAYCPVCFEELGKLRRMKRVKSSSRAGKDAFMYKCFVCDHEEIVYAENDIPF